MNTGIMITGQEDIARFRLCVMRQALRLEILGLQHSSGLSMYSRIKRDFDLRGTRKSVLRQFSILINWKDLKKETDAL